MTCFFVTLFLVIVIPYVGIPLLLRSKITLRSEPVLAPLAPEDLPADVVAHFAKAAQPLATNEFEPVAYFSAPDVPPGGFSFIAFWTSPKAQDLATVIVSMEGGTLPMTKQTKTVHTDFYSVFDNGFRIVTSNDPRIPWTPAAPGQDVVQVMDVESPAVVYRLHSNRASRLMPAGAAKVLPAAGEEMAWFRGLVAERIRQQQMAGYLEPGTTAGTSRLSMKGAFAMGASMLPPVHQIRRWRVREKGEAQLKLARGSTKVH